MLPSTYVDGNVMSQISNTWSPLHVEHVVFPGHQWVMTPSVLREDYTAQANWEDQHVCQNHTLCLYHLIPPKLREPGINAPKAGDHSS